MFVEEMKIEEERGGKYLIYEKENIFMEKENREIIWKRKVCFCKGEEKQRRKRRELFGEREYIFAEEKIIFVARGGRFL